MCHEVRMIIADVDAAQVQGGNQDQGHKPVVRRNIRNHGAGHQDSVPSRSSAREASSVDETGDER